MTGWNDQWRLRDPAGHIGFCGPSPSVRRGQWAQTAAGRQFWPLDPRPEDIHIDDIAAGLSRLCRYAGQLRDDIDHYSIAEHSVCLARYFHARGEIDLARQAANLPLESPIHQVSQSQAAQLTNVGEHSVRSARRVIDSGDEGLAAAVDQGKLAVSVAAKIAELHEDDRKKVLSGPRPEKAIKKVAREKREEALADKQRALPDKKYGVIYADPEWRFEVYSRESGMDRAADNHYPTSDLDAICARDVGSIAADDCALFLWVTGPMLARGAFLRVLEAWGFKGKSCITWAKDRIGTGYWTRDKAEYLIIATRGNVPCPAMGDQCDSLIEAPVGPHSAKPECFAEIIERYFPRLPKIELNRRGPPRPGWDAWGNEADEKPSKRLG